MSHPLLDELASGDAGARAAACRRAAGDPAAVLLVDALADALGDADPRVARAASDALVTIGPRCEAVDGLLRRALRSDRPNARWAAAFASARLAPPGPGLLPPLVEALASRWGDVRWRAAQLLARTGALVPEVGPLVAGLVRGDARPAVRRMAVHCLRELGRGDEASLPALLAATDDADPGVRRAAYSALAALDVPPAEVAERLLAAAAGETDPAGRELAVSALAEISARRPEALPQDGVARLRALLAATPAEAPRRALARVLEQLAESDAAAGAGAQNRS